MSRLTAYILILACFAGVVSADGAAVTGTLYTEPAPMPEATAGSDPTTCTPFQESECWRSCGAQIENPYCTALTTACTPTDGGGVTCTCWYFCVSVAGQSWKPKDKMAKSVEFPALALNADDL